MTRYLTIAALWIGLLPYVLIESVVEHKEKKLLRASEACECPDGTGYRGRERAPSHDSQSTFLGEQ